MAHSGRSMESDSEVILGVHAVEEALASDETLRRVLIGTHRRNDPAVAAIIGAASRRGIPISFEPQDRFRALGRDRHQHVAAFGRGFGYASWPELLDSIERDEEALIVAIDHIEDPHNLGAILRNAEAAGCRAVVMPQRRNAAVTPAVRRAAAGAASHLPVSRVPNMSRALGQLKKAGQWIIGAAANAGARPYTAIDLTGRCTIVIGSEGGGLSRLVAENCDLLACIPMRGRVSSLNAAAAAAVLLFEAVRQRAQRRIVLHQKEPQVPANP